VGVEVVTQGEHLQQIRVLADALAAALVQASEEGVSHVVILPQLIASFRAAFGGEMPPALAAQIAATMR
jgi:hypothetical protein